MARCKTHGWKNLISGSWKRSSWIFDFFLVISVVDCVSPADATMLPGRTDFCESPLVLRFERSGADRVHGNPSKK